MTSRVAQVFSQVLQIPQDQVSDATSPENTPQWDSLSVMALVTALEDEFEIRLSAAEIVSMRSVGTIRSILQAKGIAEP